MSPGPWVSAGVIIHKGQHARHSMSRLSSLRLALELAPSINCIRRQLFEIELIRRLTIRNRDTSFIDYPRAASLG